MKRTIFLATILAVVMMLSACNVALDSVKPQVDKALDSVKEMVTIEDNGQTSDKPSDQQAPVKGQENNQPAIPAATPGEPMVNLPSDSAGVVSAYEGALTKIYEVVNPSVVNIRVLSKASGSNFQIPGEGIPGLPFDFSPFGNGSEQGQMPYMEGQGSGFVWSKDGYIVTNNHVVQDASKIEVTFWDGTSVDAELIGTDPDSDLAVIKVDMPEDQLQPIQLADSRNVKVGELAIAIGNPYGLNGSMTVGIVSAVGRTTAAGESATGTANYSIPDVIQTDAPINPGNSGGVLVDNFGQVIGVTYMIESASGANAGIGFAIPASIVSRVVPSLIQSGGFEHPYIGISGSTLTPDVRAAMKLDEETKGVLVGEISPDSPADKAGLKGSQDTATIDGIEYPVGGDIITAFNGTAITSMDQLISLLASDASVGDQVTLSILRDGKAQEVNLTLEARPSAQRSAAAEPEPRQVSTRPWMGITAGSLTAGIAEAMDLPNDQTGILIEQVSRGSPADDAGLRGSDEAATINGQPVLIGGDVIIAIGGDKVESMEDLSQVLENYKPGDEAVLTIIRGGKNMEVTITFGERPATQ